MSLDEQKYEKRCAFNNKMFFFFLIETIIIERIMRGHTRAKLQARAHKARALVNLPRGLKDQRPEKRTE